jgi:hypothetical protein
MIVGLRIRLTSSTGAEEKDQEKTDGAEAHHASD